MRIHKLIFILIAFISCNPKEQSETYLSLQKIPFKTEFASSEPNLTLSVNNEVILSWVEVNDKEAYLRYSKLNGDHWEDAITIAQGNDWFINWADFPSLVSLKDGMAAHYLAYMGEDKYAYGVKVVTGNKDNPWSKTFVPHDDNTPTEHGFVSLLPLSVNEFMIIWLDGRKYAASDTTQPKEMTLRSAIYTLDGEKLSEQIIDERTCDCCQTNAILTSKGPVVVYRDRSGMEIRDIYLSRFESGSWTTPHPVHSDEWQIPGCPVNGPAIVSADSALAVSWFTAAKNIPRVYLAFSHDEGTSFEEPIQVDKGNPMGRVDLETADNFVLVTWMEASGNKSSIYTRKVYMNGVKEEPVLVYETENSRAAGFPRMIGLKNEFIFAWTQPGDVSEIQTMKGILK